METSIREDGINKIEVHVASICVRGEGNNVEVLIAKRNEQRKLYPGLWECGGGQVREGENFNEALLRQVKEEFSLNVKILSILGFYEIDVVTPKIPGIKFLCTPVDSNQEAVLNPREHLELKWIKPEEVGNFKFIGNIADEIRLAFTEYQLSKSVFI